jgi:hypothetical protein
MGNVADCCSRTHSKFASEAASLPGSAPINELKHDAEVNWPSSGLSSTPSKEHAHKGGNRLLTASGSHEDTHRKYVRMLEEKRRNRSAGEDSQKGWEMDDTDLIESTLYLDETTAYQGPLTDDETGFSPMLLGFAEHGRSWLSVNIEVDASGMSVRSVPCYAHALRASSPPQKPTSSRRTLRPGVTAARAARCERAQHPHRK